MGLTASLQCKVSSDPSVPFNIDWYRDGQLAPIMNSQRVGVQADGTLEIQAVRASDVGVYYCMVCINNDFLSTIEDKKKAFLSIFSTFIVTFFL